MRILIQPSGLECLNVGDQAMLETAYGRLRAMWPRADIRVFTKAPEAIRRTLPDAIPLSLERCHECLDPKLFGRLSKSPYPFSKVFRRLEDLALHYTPGLQAFAAQARMRVRGHSAPAHLVAAFRSTDLYLFSGAGMITDAFAGLAIEALELLRFAGRFGARTAILGHMLGPVQNPELKTVCQAVLPRVDLITLREGVTSLPLLAACGVDPEHVRVTGDETIDFVLKNRVAVQDRNAIGVNIRIAYYSGFSPSSAELLNQVLRRLSQRFCAPLRPLPVAHHEMDNDVESLKLLDSAPVTGLETNEPATPLSLVRRVADCRLVITGSYHAGVFALAQGIPVVGLAFDPYYEAKFKGLRNLFGDGCRYIDGSKPGWQEELLNISTDLWRNAEKWESGLIEAAKKQSETSLAAYRDLQALVGANQKRRQTTLGEPVPSRAAAI